MKRPCYLAGGTTEREDPPSGSHVVTHTYIYIYTDTHARATCTCASKKDGVSQKRHACVREKERGEGGRDGVGRTRTGDRG